MQREPFQRKTKQVKTLYNPTHQHDACGVGFVARLDAHPRHDIVEMGVSALSRMAHRGGSVVVPQNADGAGLLFPIPRDFMRMQFEPLCGPLPDVYGLAHLFLSTDEAIRSRIEVTLTSVLLQHSLKALAWRDTPIREEILSDKARKVMPAFRQLLIAPLHPNDEIDPEEFERTLYIARKHIENEVRTTISSSPEDFHAASFSSNSIVYKAMLSGGRLAEFFPDLNNRNFAVHFAIFHERFSTNTEPAWRLAQPFHCLAHNGEINTLRCNQSNMKMREPSLHSSRFGVHSPSLTPVLDADGSDSAMLDNAFQMLVQSGRSMAHAAMMLLPEPFGETFIMGEDKRAFYEYHAALMEPWDGPAALVFTDAKRQIGAMLDRNALRPCRYAVTKDGVFLLASEAGVLDIAADTIVQRGRLHPRRMLLVDFLKHRVITDAECKGSIIYNKPYRHWIRDNGVTLRDLPKPVEAALLQEPSHEELLQQQKLYGFSKEDVVDILKPMAMNSQEPIASMGTDIPLAVLSTKPQLLFSYLKQCFAQVTNPPIDPLREGLVMTLTSFAGKRRNLLEESPEHYSLLRLPNPILFAEDILRLKASAHPDVKVAVLPMVFYSQKGKSDGNALKQGLDYLFDMADAEIEKGATILLLSDEMADKNHIPIPSLLAVSGLHHHLMRTNRRNDCSIIVDTGEAREVMHIAQLAAFGANAVHPRVACSTVHALALGGHLGEGVTVKKATIAYSTALQKGLLKTFSRMGISTMRSFICGQSFEALGFSKELVDKYFTGLPSRIGGIGLAAIEADALARHQAAYGEAAEAAKELVDSGRYRNRANGERHLWSPAAIRSLHKAVRENDYASFKQYCKESDEQAEIPVTLRSFLDFTERTPIPLEAVEPAESIMRRFVGAAMSYGSISPEAHEAIAIAFNKIGARSNCGEGGESPSRNLPDAHGNDRRSRIRQIASGRFGVTAEYIVHADEVQIKMAQGAKPGEGGQLPAHKVLPHIAEVRHTTPGVTLISPPPHHDIYSIEDLAQLIFDIKRVNPEAKVSVKLVAGSGVGTIASGVAKAGADIILVSSHDGGTGASPRTAINFVGLPWELGLAETHTTLLANGLRKQLHVQVDGMLRTGRDLVIAALLGAEEFGFGTGLLVALGCCMLRVCHIGSCTVGVATQDEKLRCHFKGEPEHVIRYLRFLADDMRQHMAALGFTTVEEMIGHADVLRQERATLPRGGSIDLTPVITPLECGKDMPQFCTEPLKPFADSPLDVAMLETLMPSILSPRPARYEGFIRNTDRAIGARIAGEVAKHHGSKGLTPGMLDISLTGTAGQSAGAFLTRGITMTISGEANDYVGKGLSGGIIAVAPPKISKTFDSEQAAVGNVALYGATSGEGYFCGTAGERFAVRNSGATAVVEGVGDHACEYMTGGVVVVLGKTGYNFAAGMSGGYAYVFDRSEMFQTRCNLDGVDLESVWHKDDASLLRSLLTRHVRFTGSQLALAILEDWDATLPLFLKVTPIHYLEALQRMKQSENTQAESIAATEEVYLQ